MVMDANGGCTEIRRRVMQAEGTSSIGSVGSSDGGFGGVEWAKRA